MPEQIAYNVDCMEYMATVPDKYFDLAVGDPPYGGGAHAAIGGRRESYEPDGRERGLGNEAAEPFRRSL